MRYLLYKAAPITKDKPVADTEIVISKEIPTLETLEAYNEFYAAEAAAIMAALENSLPQGTRYQLLILMLKSQLNLYRGL